MREISEQPQLSERDSTLSQSLLGGPLKLIAHELRSPLTSLRLALQIGLGRVQRGRTIEPTTFEKALAQVDDLAALITALSDAAIIASGEFQLELEAVDIVELLQEATGRVRHSDAKHPLQFNPPRASTYVLVDRHFLVPAIASLIDNACKFSPRLSHVRVSMDTTDREVHFSIADCGIGVPVLERERVFELFYRASNASRTSTQGLGLGLFTAREIIARHDGRIWLESELDQGSTFHVSLPVHLID